MRPRVDAADKLWSTLQEHPIARFGFRRGARMGPFTVDIVCPAARLVVLIEDGSADRAPWLEASGYRVLTFTKVEASNPPTVLDAIAGMFELRAVPSCLK
jgi:very-short-patch-repair endonuclease